MKGASITAYGEGGMTMTDVDEIVARALKRAWEYDLPAPPDFDEDAYLAACPDVAAAIKNGQIKSPFVHYVMVGRSEGRPRPVRKVS